MSTLDTGHAETQHPPTTTNGAGGTGRIRRQGRHSRPRRSSMAGCSSETTTDGSFGFSDNSEDEYHSWRSSMVSITGGFSDNGRGGGGDGVDGSGSLDELTSHGVVSGSHSGSCRPDNGEVDLESGRWE